MAWHRTDASAAQSILATGLVPLHFNNHGSSLTEGGYFTLPDHSGRRAQRTVIHGAIPGPVIQAHVKLTNPLVLHYGEGEKSPWKILRYTAGGPNAIQEERNREWKESGFQGEHPPSETVAMRHLLKQKGYDGVIYLEREHEMESSQMWGSQAVVFDSDDPAKVMWEANPTLTSRYVGEEAKSPRKARKKTLVGAVQKRAQSSAELVDWDTFVARLSPEPVVKLLAIQKGEHSGHAFRGNQYTGGISGPAAPLETHDSPEPKGPSDYETRGPYGRDMEVRVDKLRVGDNVIEGPDGDSMDNYVVSSIQATNDHETTVTYTHTLPKGTETIPITYFNSDIVALGNNNDFAAKGAAQQITQSVHEIGGVNWEGKQVDALGKAGWGNEPAIRTKIDINARLVQRLHNEMLEDPKLAAWADERVKRLKLDNKAEAQVAWNTIVGIDQAATDALDKKNFADYQQEFNAWKANVEPVIADMHLGLKKETDWVGVIADLKRGFKQGTGMDLEGNTRLVMSHADEVFTTVGPHLTEARDIRVGDELRESYNVGGTWIVGAVEPSGDEAGRLWVYDNAGAKRLLLNKTDTVTVSDVEYGKLGWGEWATKLSFADAKKRLDAIPDPPPGPGERGPNEVPRFPQPSDPRDVALASKIRNNIDTWAGSSGDSRVTSIALQRAAAEHFHLDPAYQKPLQDFSDKGEVMEYTIQDDPDMRPYVVSAELRRTNATQVLANDVKAGDVLVADDDDSLFTVGEVVDGGDTVSFLNAAGSADAYFSKIPKTKVLRFAPPNGSNTPWAVAGRMVDAERPFYDHFTQAVYDNTQDELQRRGIKELYLYRGMRVDDPDKRAWSALPIKTYTPSDYKITTDQTEPTYDVTFARKDVRPIVMQPLSSWSAEESTADSFGDSGSDGDVILTAVIPAKRVFSLASGTGIGSLPEREVVTFGGKGVAQVEWKHVPNHQWMTETELHRHDLTGARFVKDPMEGFKKPKAYVATHVSINDLKYGMKLGAGTLTVDHIAHENNGQVAVYITDGSGKSTKLGPYPDDKVFEVDPKSFTPTTPVKVKDLKPGMVFDNGNHTYATVDSVEPGANSSPTDPTFMVGFHTPGVGPSQGLYGATGVFDVTTHSMPAAPPVIPILSPGTADNTLKIGGSDIPSDSATLATYTLADLLPGDDLPYGGHVDKTIVWPSGEGIQIVFSPPGQPTYGPKVQKITAILPTESPLGIETAGKYDSTTYHDEGTGPGEQPPLAPLPQVPLPGMSDFLAKHVLPGWTIYDNLAKKNKVVKTAAWDGKDDGYVTFTFVDGGSGSMNIKASKAIAAMPEPGYEDYHPKPVAKSYDDALYVDAPLYNADWIKRGKRDVSSNGDIIVPVIERPQRADIMPVDFRKGEASGHAFRGNQYTGGIDGPLRTNFVPGNDVTAKDLKPGDVVTFPGEHIPIHVVDVVVGTLADPNHVALNTTYGNDTQVHHSTWYASDKFTLVSTQQPMSPTTDGPEMATIDHAADPHGAISAPENAGWLRAAWKNVADSWTGSHGFESTNPLTRKARARKVRELGTQMLRGMLPSDARVDLHEMAPGAVIDLVKGIDELRTQYPQAVANISHVQMVSSWGSGTGTASAWVQPDPNYHGAGWRFEVSLAEEDFADARIAGSEYPDSHYVEFTASTERARQRGYTTASGPADIMWHEFGHLVHNTAIVNALSDKGVFAGPAIKQDFTAVFKKPTATRSDGSEIIPTDLAKAFAAIRRGNAHISKYGGSDGFMEAFGDLFAAQHNGTLGQIINNYPISRQKSIQAAIDTVEDYATRKPAVPPPIPMVDTLFGRPITPSEEITEIPVQKEWPPLRSCEGMDIRQFGDTPIRLVPLAKGESAGHPFRGNQYIAGQSNPAAPGAPKYPKEFLDGAFWHGSPNGEAGLKVAAYGVHVGTHEAAKQALEARIGKRADGKDWDGTQEYGKTLIASSGTGYGNGATDKPHYPQEARYYNPIKQPGGGFKNGPATKWEDREPGKVYNSIGPTYSDSSPIPLDAKPSLFPVRIVGEMTNTPRTPHEDWKANGYMRGALKRGNAKRGYYYTNEGEDDGSISAVVPSRAHLQTYDEWAKQPENQHARGPNPGPLPDARTRTTALIKQAIEAGGFTWHPADGNVPKTGFVVATGEPSLTTPLTEPVNNTQRKQLRQAILQYLNDHNDEFAANDALHLGGWWDKADGQFVLDKVEVVGNKQQAIRLGNQRNQKAIWDIENESEIDTGGTGDYDTAEQLRKADPRASARGPGRARGVGGSDAGRTARPRFFGGSAPAAQAADPVAGPDLFPVAGFRVAKGEKAGHAFRGNQYVAGIDGEQKVPALHQPLPKKDQPATHADGVALHGTPNGRGTPDDPIDVGDNVDQAITLIARGKSIRLHQPDEVSLMVEKMADYSAKLKALGKNAPDFNLCLATVKGTNIFCGGNKGIARIDMPQLAGWTIPDDATHQYYANTKKKNVDDPKEEVSVADEFRTYLQKNGIAVTDGVRMASHLRATQNELVGAKVGGMLEAQLAGKWHNDEPLWITKDGYVLDGHHRWASYVAKDLVDGKVGNLPIKVRQVNIDIGTALDLSKKFGLEMGIAPASGTPNAPKQKKVKKAKPPPCIGC